MGGILEAWIAHLRICRRVRRAFVHPYRDLRGDLEMERGQYDCNRRLAKDCYEKALATAEKSSRPEAKEIVELARERLALLAQVGLKSPGSPPRGFGHRPEDAEQTFAIDDLRRMVEETCKSMGVDPEVVMEGLADELPPGFLSNVGERRMNE